MNLKHCMQLCKTDLWPLQWRWRGKLASSSAADLTSWPAAAVASGWDASPWRRGAADAAGGCPCPRGATPRAAGVGARGCPTRHCCCRTRAPHSQPPSGAAGFLAPAFPTSAPGGSRRCSPEITAMLMVSLEIFSHSYEIEIHII